MGEVEHSTATWYEGKTKEINDVVEVLDSDKCRERRMRRIQERRRRLCLPQEVIPSSPEFGVMSVAGRRRDMEDAVCVRTNLCRPDITRRMPVHFFAVYDGHGGPQVAALCREKLHVLLEEELMRVGLWEDRENAVGVEKLWRVALSRAFKRMDEIAISSCSCGAVGYSCANCHPIAAMSLGGSTANVAIVTPHHLVVANCGDSRAVLCRASHTLPVSLDHKPDRPDELARIESAGGRVINLKGARVQGILAMSRAIGDKFLKPLVISEPEITITKRDPKDECLIIASDGLWDVMSSEMACQVACECLKEAGDDIDGEGCPSMYPSQSALAAALLTRLALGRESSDNISVIVVDLRK